MHALIDGDLVLYRAACAVEGRWYIGYDEQGTPVTCAKRKVNLGIHHTAVHHHMINKESYGEACSIIDGMLEKITKVTHSNSDTVYLTGDDNFRRDIYPEYKAHRPAKPILVPALTEYMVEAHGAIIVNGQEADDAMGIAQSSNSYPTTICSYDKDMLMITGKHYRFDRGEHLTVTEEEGMLSFYKQLLTGDATDNIPGIKGIGPKKAAKILEERIGEDGYYAAVLAAYEGDVDTVTRNARLLWIRQEEGELWSPPV